MEYVLVSSCLLGKRVRYNAEAATIQNEIFDRWREEGRLFAVCPEIAGGLPVPRPPAERVGLRIVSNAGVDVTHHFVAGAEEAVRTAKEHNIRLAILKDGSPSCGSSYTYDGTFTGTTVAQPGMTTAALQAAGVRCFSEKQLDEAAAYLSSLEAN